MDKRHILIVEDDVALSGMYRTALDFLGFDVDVASDGLSALWRIEARRPDVIVLDLSLPRLRGEAILTELAASAEMSQIPVVVVTGTEPEHDVAVQAGAVLRKPCDPDRLASAIDVICSPPKQNARISRTPLK